MTMLEHPTSGENELWRSNAYDSLDSLKKILKNPRLHTGVGYRRAADRKYACCVCGELRGAELFSKNQTRNPVGTQKCKECLDKKAVSVDEVTSQLDGFALEQAQDGGGSEGGGGGSSPLYRSRTEKLAAQAAGGGGGAGGSALTAGNLERHDQKSECSGGVRGDASGKGRGRDGGRPQGTSEARGHDRSECEGAALLRRKRTAWLGVVGGRPPNLQPAGARLQMLSFCVVRSSLVDRAQ